MILIAYKLVNGKKVDVAFATRINRDDFKSKLRKEKVDFDGVDIVRGYHR